VSKKTKVYLSGRMDGVSVEEGNGWRLEASQILTEAGFDVYNPYDGKSKNKTDHRNHTPNEIHDRDIYFLDRSDIVLASLLMPEVINSKDAPFFTIGEMYLAHRDRRPIIAFTNCFNGRHGYEAIVSKSLTNLEDCLEYIINNY